MRKGLFGWLSCLALFIPVSLARTEEAKVKPPVQVRTDALGDALPAHALMRIGTLRMRHQGPVTAVALAPDGKSVAALSYGGDVPVRIWCAAPGPGLVLLRAP